MNIIDIQDDLKNLPENALMQEFQQPTGNAPQFLILGELKRRKQMREDYQRQQNSDMKTVAEETITGAGVPQEGIMQMSRAMTPKTNMAQDTGIAQATPVQPTQAPQPQMMSDGGVVRFANGGMSGGTLGAIASLKVNHPNIYEMVKDDDEKLLQYAQLFQQTASESEISPLEELEAPRKKNFFNTMTGFESGQAESSMFNDPTARSVRRALAELDASQPDRIQQSMDASQANLAERGDEDPIFSEGSPVEYTNATPAGGVPSIADVITETPTLAVPSFDTSFDGGSGFTAGDETSLPALLQQQTLPQPSTEMDSTYQQIVDANNRQDMMERMTGLEPNEDIYTSETDRRRAALADPNSVGKIDSIERYYEWLSARPADAQAFVDRLGPQGSRLLRGTRDELIQPTPDEGTTNPIDRLNQRSADYYQSDLSTPKEDVYGDVLGGNIYDMLRYEEETPEEIDNVSNLLAATARADEQRKDDLAKTADEERLTPEQVEAARQAEVKRMIDVNEIPEPRIAGGLEDFVTTEVDRFKGTLGSIGDAATKYLDARGKQIGAFDGDMDTGEPLSIPSEEEGGIASLLPPKPKKSSDNAVATKQTSGGASGAGFGSLDSRIATMLSERQKQSESDKWMALAQAGFQIMSSKSPTLLGAVGEGGQAGLKALGASKKGAQDFETDMLKLQTQLDIAQQRARSSGVKIPAGFLTDLRKQAEEKTAQLASLKDPKDSFFGGRTDPDAAIRDQLQKELRIIEGQIDYMYRSRGLPTVSATSPRTKV